MARQASLLRTAALIAASLFCGLAGAQTGTTPAPAAVPPATTTASSAMAQQAQPVPASRWTLEQIRQAFALADTDGNGQLTRAEAQRLPIMPRSFEDMDENKDGAIVLREYEASFGR